MAPGPRDPPIIARVDGSRVHAWWSRAADAPWVLGDPGLPGEQVFRRSRRMVIAAIVVANAVGASVVAAFIALALPKPPGDAAALATNLNLVLAVIYLVASLILGVGWGRRRLERGPDNIRAWLVADRVPGPAERLRVLRAPLRIMRVQAVLWGTATICFAALNSFYSGLLGLGVGLTVALGGVTTSAAAYLLGELALRPVASRALSAGGGVPERAGVPGVAARWLLAWALGTAVPVVGLIFVGVVALTSVEISETALAVTILTLCGFALLFGAFVAVLAAYATVHPIASIRDALARVRAGDFDVELRVWDSTEIGMLQAGFNDMAAGLRERERIRDLFGRHVGVDVARAALAHDVSLGGEVREVTVLFVDLVGSTSLAGQRPPHEVVALLNRFFGEVVDVVEERHGWIDKFQGDAALAVFGAPIPVADAETAALAAAREIDRRLRATVGELTAGIGVASGAVVAGHVGAERRFEYTVIGDAVNAADRLTDLAKRDPARVLAAAATVERAGRDEARHWEIGEEVGLRGRATPTRVARPRAST